MNEEIVYLENMSSPRDILLVSQTLELLGLRVKEIEIGAAAYMNPSLVDKSTIAKALANMGYTLVDAEVKLYTEKIRSLISTHIDNMLRNQKQLTLEAYLEQQCEEEFSVISERFLKTTGQSLQAFYKRMRIERSKILLVNTGLDLHEIAKRLDFKHVQDLARMFKEVTEQSIADYAQRQLVTPIHKFA